MKKLIFALIVILLTLVFISEALSNSFTKILYPKIIQEKAALEFFPSSSSINVGESVKLDVKIKGLQDNLMGLNLKISFDAGILQAESVTEGDFLKKDGASTFFKYIVEGSIIDIAIARLTEPAPGSSGALCSIIFKGINSGTSTIKFNTIDLRDYQGKAIEATGLSASIEVKSVAPFTDSKGHWAEKEINILYTKGVVKGYPDNTVRPNSKVTRAEFCALIVRAFGIEEYRPTKPTFPDVSSSHWAYAYIEGLAKTGFVKGYPDKKFRPEGEVTKAEAITVVVRVMNYPLQYPDIPSLLDVLKDKWYYPYIEAAVFQNVIKIEDPHIVESKNFQPNTPAIRAQIYVFLVRALKLR